MKNIEVKILNPDQLTSAENMMVQMARLTQRAQTIRNMADFVQLLHKPYKESTLETMCKLPHPTLQKFGLINIAVVGASRRFLAQITRHQNEVKFMSGSLQYSDYTDAAQFCVPYEITRYDRENAMDGWAERQYLNSCLQSMDDYKKAAPLIGNDAAGYMAPQGMRNVLLISALPYELKHIINQRTCNRNTLETQYVLLKIWEKLWDLSPLFRIDCGPDCMHHACTEGKMSCGRPFECKATPTAILHREFPYLED